MKVAVDEKCSLMKLGLRKVLIDLDPNVEIIESNDVCDLLRMLDGENSDFSLIILGICPASSPVDNVKAVRHRYSGPLAVLSDSSDRASLQVLLSSGVNGYIDAKMRPESIVAALRIILEGDTFIPSNLFDSPLPSPSRAGIRQKDRFSTLSLRERQVLTLVSEGLTNKHIARQLDLQEVTVKAHMTSTFKKLRVQNRVQAARAMLASQYFASDRGKFEKVATTPTPRWGMEDAI